jgi:hypothetical protein
VDRFKRPPTGEGFRDIGRGGEVTEDDSVEGHIMGDEIKDQGQDVEGHLRSRAVPDDEDVEGHGFRKATGDDDTEGHMRSRAVPDDEDVEGHAIAKRLTDDDDTEGHAIKKL